MNKTWKIIIAIVGALLCVDIAIRVFDNKESSAEKTNAPISLEGKSVQETYGTLPVAEVTSLESSATEKSTSVIDNTSNEVFSTATFTVEIPTTVAPIKSETTTTPMTIAPTQPETTGAPTTIAPTEPETTAALTTAAPTEPETKAPKSSEARLKSLSFSTGSLEPGFNSDVYSYRLNVSAATNGVKVDYSPVDEKANIIYWPYIDGTNGQISVGESVFTVRVTAEDGTVKDYKITIYRPQPETTAAPTTIAPTEPETTAAPTTAAPTEPPTEPMVPDPNTCDHSYQLEYEFPPTATSTGEKCYRCSKCGHVYREIIEKLPHDHEWTQYTIFSNGFKYPTGTIITYSAFICDTCGACYKADENNRYVKTDEFNAHLATHGEDAPWHSGFSTMPCEDFYSDLEQSTDYFCRICGAKKP